MHGGISKSACENQIQFPTTRIETSNMLPVDVVEDSSPHSEGGGHNKTYTRLTRSKDAKLKGVSMSQENSQEAVKGRGGEKSLKKMRAAKGGAKKRVGTETTIG